MVAARKVKAVPDVTRMMRSVTDKAITNDLLKPKCWENFDF